MKKHTDLLRENISSVEKTIGYTFKDKALLMQAFTRTSYCNEHSGKGQKLQSNEVLEFFGDGVLSAAIITFLLQNCSERYEYGIRTQLTEGDFSNIKSKLSDKKNLSECTLSLGLQKYLRMGEGDVKLGIDTEPSVMEDLFESIIGAVYIDSGLNMSAVMKVVAGMLDIHSYAVNTPPIQSSKNALQEWCADKRRRLPQPVYKTLHEDGPDHKKTYERGCYIADRLVGRGFGKNLKLADASAAESALILLMSEAAEDEKTKEKSNPPQIKKEKPSTPRESSAKKPPQKNRGAKHPTNASEQNTAKKAAKDTDSVKSKAQNSQRASSQTNESPVPSVKIQAQPSAASATLSLKSYASSNKTATPTFKDLGQTRAKDGHTEYRIECRFMGASAIGTGSDRPTARERAASLVKSQLSIGSKKAKTAPRVKKNRSKIT